MDQSNSTKGHYPMAKLIEPSIILPSQDCKANKKIRKVPYVERQNRNNVYKDFGLNHAQIPYLIIDCPNISPNLLTAYSLVFRTNPSRLGHNDIRARLRCSHDETKNCIDELIFRKLIKVVIEGKGSRKSVYEINFNKNEWILTDFAFLQWEHKNVCVPTVGTQNDVCIPTVGTQNEVVFLLWEHKQDNSKTSSIKLNIETSLFEEDRPALDGPPEKTYKEWMEDLREKAKGAKGKDFPKCRTSSIAVSQIVEL